MNKMMKFGTGMFDKYCFVVKEKNNDLDRANERGSDCIFAQSETRAACATMPMNPFEIS